MRWSALLLAIAAGLFAGCRADERPRPDPAPAPSSSHIEFLPAPGSDDLPATVRRELQRAAIDGRALVVYVGATWCEPCQHFHDAATAGELDRDLPSLRLLEFDLDRDRERLKLAGYASKMIPLFALPREDGTASGEQIEGSIKGPGAASEITPRLRALLARRTRR